MDTLRFSVPTNQRKEKTKPRYYQCYGVMDRRPISIGSYWSDENDDLSELCPWIRKYGHELNYMV